MSFENKLVAIINKDIDPGVAMNAIAHITLGLGSSLPPALLRLDDYEDKEGNIYPHISQMPFIILRARSIDIKKTLMTAKGMGIKLGAFTNTMTGGTYEEQLDNTAQTSEDHLIYYACVLFGAWESVSQITKKFSLYT